MIDNIDDVLHELSGILRRISDQRNEQCKPQAEEARAHPPIDLKLMEHADVLEGVENAPIRESALEFLDHQHHVLENLIARIQEKPKKG